MVKISARPAEVEDRAVPGHWEGDLIVGPKTRSAVGTPVERSTRYVLLLHLPDGHTADKVRIAMTNAIGRLPAELAQSITWDQGSEMAQQLPASRMYPRAEGLALPSTVAPGADFPATSRPSARAHDLENA